MASTYVNDLRLNEMATGDASGTWGTTTNTNLELIAEGLSFGTEAITTNADTHTSTVADGATDPARSIYIKYTGTLDSACTITIAPNTISRLHFIENGTSGSQNIIISQGSGANVTIPAGDTKAVYLDGAGSGAAVVDAFASLNVVDLKVQDDLTVTDDASVGGDLLVSGEVQTANIGFTDGDNALTISDGGSVSFAAGVTLAGTTPTLTIGDAGAEDTKIVFDGNAQDFYIGLDDSADDLVIGKGSAVGTTPAISIDENLDTSFGGDVLVHRSAADVRLVLGSNGNASNSNNDTNHIRADGDDLKLNTCADGQYIFEVNGSEHLRITTSGDIKNTGGTATTHTIFADSGSSEGSANITFNTDGASTDQSVANIKMQQGSGDGAARKAEILFQVSDNGAPATAMTIANNGNVGLGTSSPAVKLHVAGGIRFSGTGTDANRYNVYWNSSTGDLIVVSSDARLKKDFDYDIAGIETVNKLKPVRYTWKDSNKRQLGFTAQESIEADEHLAWNNVEDDTWGLDGWEGYSAVLTKAIQELSAKNDALEARLKTLEDA
jgi:hypothetical protein